MSDLPFVLDPAFEDSAQLGGELLLDDLGTPIGFDTTLQPRGMDYKIDSKKRKPSPVPEPGKVAKQKTSSDMFKAGTCNLIQGDTVNTGASHDGIPGGGAFRGGATVRNVFQIPNLQGDTLEYYPWSGGIVNRDTVRGGIFSHYDFQDDITQDYYTQGRIIQGDSLRGDSLQGGLVQGVPIQGGLIQGGLIQGGLIQSGLIQDGLVHGGNLQGNITQSGPIQGDSVQDNNSHGGLIQSNTSSGTPSSTNNVPAGPNDNTPNNTGTSTRNRVASVHTHRMPVGVMRIARHGNITPTQEDLYLPFHAVYSTAPPPHVNLRLLGDVPITTFELITFFPFHYSWPDWTLRLFHAGWSATELVSNIHKLRDCNDPPKNMVNNLHKATLKSLKATGKSRKDGREPYKTFTCANWTPHHQQMLFLDYYVKDLTIGVKRSDWPTKGTRNGGPLVKTLVYLEKHPNDQEGSQLKLSGLAQFARDRGLFDDVKIDDWKSCFEAGGYGRTYPDFHSD